MQDTLARAQQVLYSGDYDLVILDEINIAMAWRMLSSTLVLEMLKYKPRNVEVVLTGRWAPKEITDYADVVTEMRLVKHPFDRGIQARRGIEY